MRSFYHCRTGRYKKRAYAVITVTVTVCAEISVIAFFVLFFSVFGAKSSFDSELALQMLGTAGTAVFAGMVISLAAMLYSDALIKRHSRFTYLDIQLKAAVLSRYSRSFTIMGEAHIYRELYYIPFSGLSSVTVTEGGKRFSVKGGIRRYMLDSNDLGYHVREGDIEFDRWWLNSGGYDEISELSFPACFGPAGSTCRVFEAAKKRFDAIPPPHKHVFKEADFIRRRSKPRVLPDDPDYSRSWK